MIETDVRIQFHDICRAMVHFNTVLYGKNRRNCLVLKPVESKRKYLYNAKNGNKIHVFALQLHFSLQNQIKVRLIFERREVIML